MTPEWMIVHDTKTGIVRLVFETLSDAEEFDENWETFTDGLHIIIERRKNQCQTTSDNGCASSGIGAEST
jgi:hypothetical protein